MLRSLTKEGDYRPATVGNTIVVMQSQASDAGERVYPATWIQWRRMGTGRLEEAIVRASAKPSQPERTVTALRQQGG
ncbi:hypothetical protein XcuCFBP2542_12675 [Xanthomonas cucurbitae]|uniref:Uncharacterized protein n=1 Tax=Xanthomonas cucurbitae TaxID=56453 RepID=A0A2S7DPV8_9XANT|nr:hypothetical protein [Xanthomonas cucurbitae]PPU75862.1 hypothetical protein XcuCFBP2542_12675 [Xanthomonas cucurbitae]WDM80384.1 hypothetical protein K6980_06840 [Xanthomonas cucurbitae]